MTSTTPAAARAVRELAPRITGRAGEALSGLLGDLALGADGDDLAHAALGALTGGKGLRGSLVVIGSTLARAVAAGSAPATAEELDLDPGILSLAAAAELYQASALVHDDVIDHSATRRGRATVQVALAEEHRRADWQGNARDFGAAGAILVGDLLLSAADHTAARACGRLPGEAASRVLPRFTLMHAEVAVGQYLDVRAEQRALNPLDDRSLTVESALEVVRRKSARYSVVHPVAVGALARGADAALVGSLERVLEPWGVAFQLRDDDLGVFGDPEVTGKPAGDDLREGKHTALLALTWQAATPQERRTLAREVGSRDLDDDTTARLRDVVRLRGRTAHELLIADLVGQGRDALVDAPLPGAARGLLADLGDLLTRRRT